MSKISIDVTYVKNYSCLYKVHKVTTSKNGVLHRFHHFFKQLKLHWKIRSMKNKMLHIIKIVDTNIKKAQLLKRMSKILVDVTYVKNCSCLFKVTKLTTSKNGVLQRFHQITNNILSNLKSKPVSNVGFEQRL